MFGGAGEGGCVYLERGWVIFGGAAGEGLWDGEGRGGEGGGTEVDGSKDFTCVLNADAQYFEDKLLGGREQKYVVLFLRC